MIPIFANIAWTGFMECDFWDRYRMPSTFSSVFSNEDVQYLLQLPEVIAASAKLSPSSSSGVVYFTIPLTETIRIALHERLGLNLSGVSEIPMRWIKGDTAPHVDSGPSDFENTFLVYLNSSEGEFVLEGESYPIVANTAFVFNEGLSHETLGTGSSPRLLVGPMNELAEPVGGAAITINYYDNYADAYATNGNTIAFQINTYVLGDTPNINGSIGAYTSWRIAAAPGYSPPLPSGVYNNGFDLAIFNPPSSFYVYPATPCFLEGTGVLCSVGGTDTYVPIETVKPGDLVKTSRDGYKKVELIGSGTIQNPGDAERIQDRLYKCSPEKYPELKDDLYITGDHSILVDTLSNLEREKIVKQSGRVFVTDRKYRLCAYLDERAEPWASEGPFKIWHLALENSDPKMNYGIYVNGGLLVETCCIHALKNKSNMTVETL
jgi:Hint domain